jgi:hypothetical protein
MSQAGASDEYNTRGDLRLTKRAIGDRWPVPQETRDKVIKEITSILDNPEADPSLKCNVARTMVSIDALNLKQEELRIRESPRPQVMIHTNMSIEELEDRAAELQKDLGISAPQALLDHEPGSQSTRIRDLTRRIEDEKDARESNICSVAHTTRLP